MSEIKKYGKEIEDLFIQFMVSDPELYVRCGAITKPDYYSSEENKESVAFITDHVERYGSLPSLQQITAVTGKTIEKIRDIDDSHVDWFLDEYEGFCRHKALELVILDSINLLKEKRYGEVESAVKQAVQIGLVKDLGLDYFDDPVARLEAIRQRDDIVSTGWNTIDQKLYGGFNKGGLHIWAAQSGGGKSLFMQNGAVNMSEQGLHSVYITLELSENLCSMRLDAMISSVQTRDIMKNMDDVALKVKAHQKKHKGTIRIKQLPNGCTTNDIRAYVKEYQIQTGIKIDALFVDYLDLLSPNNNKVGMNDTFIKDKYVSEDLRNLAIDMNVVLVTASQLNRSSYDEVEYSGANIAGGLSKINTADNVIGIFTTPSMRENGRYQIQFVKTRSSSGVGSKIDLGYDPETLRIFDLDEDDEEAESITAKDMLDNIKKRKAAKTGGKTESTEDKQDGNDIGQQAKSLRDLMRTNK